MAYERKDKYKGDREKIFGKETVAGMQETKDLSADIAGILEGIDVSSLTKDMQQIADGAKYMADSWSDSLKYSEKHKDLAQSQLKSAKVGARYSAQQTNFGKLIVGWQVKLLKGQDDFTEGLKEAVKNQKLFSGLVEETQAGAAGLANRFGDVGQAIGGFITNPMTIATAALVAFNSQQQSIADQFGAMGVTEFRDELVAVNKDFMKLGYTSAQAQTTISNLSNDFGIAFDEADNLASVVGETAKATGMTLENSGKLIGLLTKTQGLSGEQANELIRSTQALAKANNVAPDAVLEDIATNTEQFAKFSQDGGQNIMRAAIQARKLGVSLDKVAGISESILNFNDSIQKEMEASVIIGRQLNFQKARELALANDLEGATTAIVEQLGSEAEFNKLNAIQRQALADSVGIQVGELQKLVSAEKEAATLTGEMNKQKITDIVSEEAITKTAELVNNLKAFGVTIAESVGPVVNVLVKALGGLFKILEQTGMIWPILITAMALWTAKTYLAIKASTIQTLTTLGLWKAKTLETTAEGANTVAKGANTLATAGSTTAKGAETLATSSGTFALIANTGATIKNTAVKAASTIKSWASAAANMVRAAAEYFAAAASGSAATVGFGTPAMVAMAVAAVAAMVGGVMMARRSAKAGDMLGGAGIGKTQISPVEGGIYELSDNDQYAASPNLTDALNGGGGTTVQTDTSALEDKQDVANEKLDSMVQILSDALGGPRPGLARAVGNQVGDTVNGLA